MGMDPRKMEQMMKQLGVKTRNINAKKVVIEEDGQKLVVENPSVVEIEMKGQKSFQISGDVKVESSIPEDDVRMVMEQAGVSEDDAKKALEESKGDIAEAILKLKEPSK